MDTICGTKMGKLLFGLLICCMPLLFLGCDPYAHQKPDANTTWICEEPYIVLAFQEDGSLLSTMGKGEDAWEFFLGFRSGNGVDAYYANTTFSDDTMLFYGECDFGEDELVIEILEDYLWNDAYSELVFHRIK